MAVFHDAYDLQSVDLIYFDRLRYHVWTKQYFEVKPTENSWNPIVVYLCKSRLYTVYTISIFHTMEMYINNKNLYCTASHITSYYDKLHWLSFTIQPYHIANWNWLKSHYIPFASPETLKRRWCRARKKGLLSTPRKRAASEAMPGESRQGQ